MSLSVCLSVCLPLSPSLSLSLTLSLSLYIYINEGRQKRPTADQDTHPECDQMWFIFQYIQHKNISIWKHGVLFFNIYFTTIPLEVQTLFSSVLQCLDPIGQKVIHSRFNITIWIFQPMNFFSIPSFVCSLPPREGCDIKSIFKWNTIFFLLD